MKTITHSLLLFILVSVSGTLLSQDTVKVPDRVHGPDQTLYNGKKYSYFLPTGVKGDQYLFSQDYLAGSLTLRGKCYLGLTLNYDIFNQQLLLKYNDEMGALNIIEVSKAWIKRFSLGSLNFEYLNLEQGPRYYQVLGESRVQILYYWTKTLVLDVVYGSSVYTFTPAQKDSYLFMHGQLRPFRNNRGLVRLFDPVHRAQIKSYLRKNKINVKKAADQTIVELITYIGKIL
ncbi:MAG: hypothetical protein NTX61_02330 [Bacteroidetes bacterium]|nr:hypothetical protein [Bacteroidota bacterium]